MSRRRIESIAWPGGYPLVAADIHAWPAALVPTARRLVRLVFALLTKNTTHVRPKTLAQVQEGSLLQ